MFRRLILLFILIPILELLLLIQLGRWVGLWPTLALIAVTGIVGAALASHEGLRAWHAFQFDVTQGRIPGRPILDGLSIFAGGALLLTPGLLTDALGFFLVVRPTRRWLQDRVVGRLSGGLIRRGRLHVQTSSGLDWVARQSEGVAEKPAGREIEERQ